MRYKEAIEIVKKTNDLVWGYKLRRLVIDNGLKVVEEIKKYGKVMLDFKLYDIPNAITESIKQHFKHGTDITTIHCSSLYEPFNDGKGIAGVTKLTSMGHNKYYKENFFEEMINDSKNLYEYIVCSPEDLLSIKYLKIKKICPGIRPSWYKNKDDQLKIDTPSNSINNGADLLVIGRPILESHNVRNSIIKINNEIKYWNYYLENYDWNIWN